MARWS